MASLPHDIMMEIILHLPAKSLIRFKSVCKPWYSQISNSEFLIKYFIQSTIVKNETPNFFLLTHPFYPQIQQGPFKPFERPQPIPSGDRHGYFLELESNSFDKAVEIEIPQSQNVFMLPPKVIGYCNELVCLRLSKYMYLLNPFTKNCNKYELDINIGIGSSSRSLYGFGYDFAERVYVLVEITMPRGSHSCIQAFSFGDSGSLSFSSSITTPYRVLNKLECVRGEELGHCVDGSLYWLARVENRTSVNDSTDTVISYDIGKKVAAEVPLPYSVCQEHYINLGILAGKLSLVCKSCKSDMEVWVMMDSCGARNSWCRLFSIGRNIFSFRYFCWTRPLCLTKNGGIIVKDGRDLVLYDPKQNAVKNLEIQVLKDGMILSEIVPLVVGNANVSLTSGTCREKRKRSTSGNE